MKYLTILETVVAKNAEIKIPKRMSKFHASYPPLETRELSKRNFRIEL